MDIAQWEERQRYYRSRERAFVCSFGTACATQMVQFLYYFLVSAGNSRDEMLAMATCLILTQLFYFGTVTVWVAVVSATMTHWWFYNSTFSIPVITIAVTAISEFVVIGWLTVAMFRGC